MGEYDRKQKKQESRAIAYNGGGSRQLKGIVDSRNNSCGSGISEIIKSSIYSKALAQMSSVGQFCNFSKATKDKVLERP